jgi:hypothetical protein
MLITELQPVTRRLARAAGTATVARRAGLAVAAVAAVLIVGAGTAHADGAPDVTFQPGLGVLTVHIRDTSGISSWCSYHADYFNSLDFYLPANGTHDLMIRPSFPQFRNWDVSVLCDDHDDRILKYFY